MAMKLYNESSIQNIANAIREKNGSSSTYTVGEMSQAISNLTGDSQTTDISLNITGATVGQTVKISAVDDNGVPTAWESVSGGVAGVSSVNGQTGHVTITADGLGAAKQSDVFETGLKPNFTNVLPLSQNTAGDIQNELGYTYVRISGTGIEEDAANWVSTGYIPVKRNDVLRFENFGLPIGASSYCRIIAYKSDHTVASQGQINGYDAANNSSGMNYITSPSGGTNTVVLDDDGTNIIQLTMCRPSTMAYVRFTVPASGVSSKSVITVNEEIAYEAGYGTKLNGNIQINSSQIVGDLGQRSPWDILPGAHLAIAYSSIGRMAINTKEHFQDCCKNYGYNVLKCDVRPTSDGKLVLCHDAGFTLDTNGRITTYNAANSTSIHEMTATQCIALEHADSKSYGLLGYYAKPCLIGDYLDICRAYGKVAFITIRDEYMDVVVPKLLEELRTHNMMYHTIINSMTYASLVKWRAADSIVCLNYTLSRSANITSTEIDQVIGLGNAMIGGFGFGTTSNETDITCDFTYANEKKIRVINAIGYVSGAYENCIAAGYDGLQIGYPWGYAVMTDDKLQTATNAALAQAKASGEFDGAPGPKGDTGPQGPAGPAGAGMDVTGATVGQTVKISAVDSNGVPTAWEPVDMASGGGGEWRQVIDSGEITETTGTFEATGLGGATEILIEWLGLQSTNTTQRSGLYTRINGVDMTTAPTAAPIVAANARKAYGWTYFRYDGKYWVGIKGADNVSDNAIGIEGGPSMSYRWDSRDIGPAESINLSNVGTYSPTSGRLEVWVR